MPHDPGGQIHDEAIAEIVAYCKSIQGKRLKVFDLIEGDSKNAPKLPSGVFPGELFDLEEQTTGTVKKIKDAIKFMADYSEPITQDELIELSTADIDATADLICTLRTVEALIGVKEAIPSYGLKSDELKEFSKDLKALIDQGAALLSVFFNSDHRFYYENEGDFRKKNDELIFRLVKALRGQGAP